MSEASRQQLSSSGGVTPAALWRVLSAYKRFLILFIGMGTALTILYGKIMPETWTTFGTIRPPEQERSAGISSILQNSGIGLDFGGLGGGGEVSRGFVDMLKSRTLAEEVAGRVAIRNYYGFETLEGQGLIEAFQSLFTFDITNTGLVVVAAQVQTPYLATDEERRVAAEIVADMVNSAVDVLDSLNRAKSVSRARNSRLYIERYMAQTRARIDSVQDLLEQFRQDYKILALEEQINAIVTNAVKIGTEISEAEIKLELARLELSPSSPKVSELTMQLSTLKEQYRKIQEGGFVEGDAFSVPLNDIPSLSRQYAEYLTELKVLEKIYAFLETQRAQEAIQEERDIATVQVLDEAFVPEKRQSPRLSLMAPFALFIFSLLGIGIAVGHAIRRGRISTELHDSSSGPVS